MTPAEYYLQGRTAPNFNADQTVQAIRALYAMFCNWPTMYASDPKAKTSTAGAIIPLNLLKYVDKKPFLKAVMCHEAREFFVTTRGVLVRFPSTGGFELFPYVGIGYDLFDAMFGFCYMCGLIDAPEAHRINVYRLLHDEALKKKYIREGSHFRSLGLPEGVEYVVPRDDDDGYDDPGPDPDDDDDEGGD